MMNSNRKPIEKAQIIRMHTLLTALNMDEYKHTLMNSFSSDGRDVTSSKQLYYDEAYDIIKYLSDLQRNTDPDFITCDVQRKKIISCFRQMGYVKGEKADMKRIEAWVLKSGFKHEPLNSYTKAELPTLVSVVEKMLKAHLNKVDR